MGRRNRSKRCGWEEEDDDEDFGLERAEKEWLMNRSNKRQKVGADDETLSADTRSSKNKTDEPSREEVPSNDEVPRQSPKNDADANDNAKPSEKDRTERMKLKKQRQKERQREKKAKRSKTKTDEPPPSGEVLSSDEVPRQSPKNGADSNHDAKPSEVDKVEKMKLKKQRQKERRREKKAQKATAAEAMERSRKESEKATHDKRRLEQERNKKMKEKSQQGFVTLAKGVECQDLVVGKGPAVQHRKKVHVSYTLRSKSHTVGKVLDASANFGFRLGKGEVIKGWDIGLEGMKVGGVRRLVVPPAAGYGNHQDVGAGRGGDLYFQIELLQVAP